MLTAEALAALADARVSPQVRAELTALASFVAGRDH